MNYIVNPMQAYYTAIANKGEARKPRGFETKGMLNQTFSFTPGMVYTRPRMNSSIGFVELLQFIRGTFNPVPFKLIAPNAKLNLFTHQSAYGPRVLTQLPQVIEELRMDPDSRRAIMMIAHPTDKPAELPCTISMQFHITGENRLVTTVTMRSSDLVWGLPTDIIQFGGIAMVVGACLSVEPVECVVNAGNAHIYESSKLRPSERYVVGGSFSVPSLYTLDEFRTWAADAEAQIMDGASPQRIFKFQKIREMEYAEE